MNSLVVVTGKVPKELKERARELGINISRVIREALEKAVREREEELLMRSLERCASILDKVDIDRIVKHIREDRDKR